jgi:hypothetical protein
VVHREHRHDEVERARRQRVLEPCDPQVGVRERRPRRGQHLRARVDADQRDSRVVRQHARRRLARAGAELEHPPGAGAAGGGRLVLQPLVAWHLRNISSR